MILIAISSLLLLSITAFCKMPGSSKKKAAVVDKIGDSNPSGFPGTDPDNPAGTGNNNSQGDWESSGGELQFFRFRPDKTMKVKQCDASGNTTYSESGTYTGSSGTFYYTMSTLLYTATWENNGQEFTTARKGPLLKYVRTTRWNFCP